MSTMKTTDTNRIQPQPRLKDYRSLDIVKRIIWYLGVAFIVFIMLGPLLWMLSTSVKPLNEVFQMPPEFIPSKFQFNNFWEGWTALPFNTFLKNSLIISCANVIGNILSCSLIAFGFSRIRHPWRDKIFYLVLATMMVPMQATLIPRFILFDKLGWIDTLRPLIVPAWLGYPFFIFILRQFFLTIPLELDEAAKIDGASFFHIYARVIVPLAKPAIATVALLGFRGNWINYLLPLVYLSSEENYTLPIGLSLFQGAYFSRTNQMMAVALLTILPLVVIFIFTQKYFMEGLGMMGRAEK